MRRRNPDSGVRDACAPSAPYDQLRRSRHRELQHHDGSGLQHLLDDYFGNADELETLGSSASPTKRTPGGRRAA